MKARRHTWNGNWRQRIPVWTAVGWLAIAAIGTVQGEAISVVSTPELGEANDFYVGNRAPLRPSPLIKLPIGTVHPRGWVHRMLELQAEGFHGHLPEISRFLNPTNNAWLSPNGRGERGWEEEPYWLKGFGACGYLLEDQEMIREARVWIEGALNSQQEDGWFGPDEGRTGAATGLQGRADLWPNMIMLFCLQTHYEFTGDPRVPELMRRYFQYLSRVPEDQFLLGYWPKMRAGDMLWSVYWLYNRIGEKWLLDFAHKVHRHAARWDEDVINWHNVNLAQGFREPAIYFMQTQAPHYLEATEYDWLHVREIYGQVPGGMFGGDENCRPAYVGPRQAIETCGIVEEMLSDEIMLLITGAAKWGDRCEEVAFNSFPASMTPDLKALRYLTAPNQPQSDHVSKSPGIQNGGPMYLMDPHGHRCCQHNSGHGWPYFAQHLWFATPGNGLAAALYAASTVTAKVGDGTEVTVEESTHYPFDETIRLRIQTGRPVAFPLYLRIPGWCRQPQLRVNQRPVSLRTATDQYILIHRKWNNGDEVELELPMHVRLRTWRENLNSVSVSRGPLTYSLKIQERYERHGGTDQWPAWEIFPDSPWNYGLVLDAENPAETFQVEKAPWPADDQPWTVDTAPIRLRAHGRLIPEWQLDEHGLVQEVQSSPAYSDQPVEPITLIPMGAARLRISAFPVASPDPEAQRWKIPEKPPVRASHCFENDSVAAVCDGKIPADSSDASIPRLTWWPHRGTREWLEWDFSEPRQIHQTAVYWFDDTGRGQCRTPASWNLLYRKNDAWHPVANQLPFSTAKDRFNAVSFETINTDALRIEVQLQAGYSAGVLEWKLN